MARYIDLDDAISVAIQKCVDVVGHGITQVDAANIAYAFEDIPTADVVPKSEVERLEIELEKARRKYLPSGLQACSEEEAIKIGREYGKAEVAREIFEEIENWFELYSEREYSFAEEETAKEHYTEAEAHDYALDIINDLRTLCVSELKKKYTEGEPNGN